MVELPLGERERFGLIADELEPRRELGIGAALGLRPGEHLGALVEPDDAAAVSTDERCGDHPRPGRDVEDAIIRLGAHPRNHRPSPARVLAEAENGTGGVIASGQPGEQTQRVLFPHDPLRHARTISAVRRQSLLAADDRTTIDGGLSAGEGRGVLLIEDDVICHVVVLGAYLTRLRAVLGDDTEPARVSVLPQRAQITKQSMAELVAHLERHRYVERIPDPSDRRAKLVRATARGEQVYEIAREFVAEPEKAWTKRLGRDKMRRLRALLTELDAPVGGRKPAGPGER